MSGHLPADGLWVMSTPTLPGWTAPPRHRATAPPRRTPEPRWWDRDRPWSTWLLVTFAVLLILGIGGCAAIHWLDRDDASNELRTMTRELAQVQVPASTYRSKTHVGHRDCQRYQQNRTSRTERSSLGVQPLWTRLHHRVLALGWTDAGPVNPSGDHLHIHVERGFRDLYLDLKPMARGTSVELMEEGTGTECF